MKVWAIGSIVSMGCLGPIWLYVSQVEPVRTGFIAIGPRTAEAAVGLRRSLDPSRRRPIPMIPKESVWLPRPVGQR